MNAHQTVLTEDVEDLPLYAAVQRCAAQLVAEGADPAEVFRAMLSVAMAGRVASEPPLDVVRSTHALLMLIVGRVALDELDESAVRH